LFDSVQGITTVVERMHAEIARTALPWPGSRERAHGLIAAGVYQAIRGVNHGLRESIDWSLRQLPASTHEDGATAAEVRAIAALNGVCGDHLEATSNPLATPMQLRTPEQRLSLDEAALHTALPGASPHLVVLAHGLGMSELAWTRKGRACIGAHLRDDLGYTPLYLRYNSGRHISTNGREFAAMLERLCENWPVPVQSISLVGHSMGGLVIRSACRYAQDEQSAWLPALRRVVCLGTPHHGSPLAKAGHAFEEVVSRLPYSAPLLLGRLRSVGVKDLRHGNLLDEDWQGHDPDASRPDPRRTVPLVEGVDYYFAAASLGKHPDDPMGHLLGDMLVRPDSAVGLHRDELRRLQIKPENCRVFHEKNHFDLLNDRRVQEQVIDWFSR
jgi:pimeloyl-ACP methyl ester carboxylesterase